jgi:hypothetical protein
MNILHKEGLTVKKKSRMEIAKDIISRVKKEMEQPRLAESVRSALEAEAALTAGARPAPSERA